MIQLSLFGDDDTNQELPLPLLVAQKWGFKLSHHEHEGDYWYAGQDWVAGINESSMRQAGKDFRRIQKQLTLTASQLDYISTNGKTYKIPYVTEKSLYLIVAHLVVKDNRPRLTQMKDYLASLGVIFDNQRLDPEKVIGAAMSSVDKYKRQGKSDVWIEARVNGIYARKQFTAAFNNAVIGVCTARSFAIATDTIHLNLLERTAKQLCSDLDITIKQNPRDHMSEYALTYIKIAEMVCAEKLGDAEYVTEAMAFEIIATVARLIHIQAKATAEVLGVDIVTGRKLLTD